MVRLVHDKLGLSQMTLANLTGYSQAHISRWLHSKGNPEGVTAARLHRFVEGLGIPWSLLGLVDPSKRGPHRQDGQPDNAVAEEATDPMRRRTLVVTTPLAMGATVLTPAAGELWRGRLGAVHARYLQQTARQLIEQNFRLGGDMLFTQAATQFETAYGKLRAGEYAASAESKLFGATGELARITAWIAHDAGLERDARYYFNEALLAARLSGNRQLAMKTYYSMSVQADESGHPDEARHLVRAARQAAKGWAPNRLLSLLTCAEARAAAGMNDTAVAQALLARARTLLETNSTDGFTEVFFFYNATELTTVEGLCSLKLRAYADAAVLRRGLDGHLAERGSNYQRNTTLVTARLALAQLGQSNVTDAAATGTAVLAAGADGVLSTRTFKVIASLANGLSAYKRVPAATSFLERWRSVAH